MRRSVCVSVLTSLIFSAQVPAADLVLPLEAKSVRFAVIGDSGTGGKGQREVGGQHRGAQEFLHDAFLSCSHVCCAETRLAAQGSATGLVASGGVTLGRKTGFGPRIRGIARCTPCRRPS